MLMGTCHCGSAQWTLEGDPGVITACNCALCRRYGALWAYDEDDERGRTTISGATTSYVRGDKDVWPLEILFCPKCGCVLCWRGRRVRPDGSRRMAVNVRLAPPEAVADLRIEHFDGLDKFAGLPSDGSCVRDLCF